jgi:hypothetical protein
MNGLRKYIKGNTIVEVLIALAITSFCIALAAVIYLNLQKSSLPFFKIKAQELAQEYLKETIENQYFFNDSRKAEEFTIKRIVSNREDFSDCYLLRILVFDNEKKKICELESSIFNIY